MQSAFKLGQNQQCLSSWAPSYEKCWPSSQEFYISDLKGFLRTSVWVPSAPTLLYKQHPLVKLTLQINTAPPWHPHGQGAPRQIQSWLRPPPEKTLEHYKPGEIQISASTAFDRIFLTHTMGRSVHWCWALLPCWGKQICWQTLNTK